MDTPSPCGRRPDDDARTARSALDAGGEVFFELKLSDAWVWDMYRPARFVKNVRVVTFKDVNVEELDKPDLELPDGPRLT